VSLGHPCKFQRVSRVGSVTARHSNSGRQPNCGVEQTAPSVVGRATITLGIGPQSSFICVRFSFSIPEEIGLGNVSKMTCFVSSGM